ncbi:MAG TPA: response regulator transcription factor [Sphingobium sp.]|uniref:response regulator transcription factor n=1 Tax=Sphingobium sp. TaxID=1912891 RepID=UPI002ED099B1
MTLNVLIVEDDHDLAETLAAQMENFGHRSTLVDNGQKALAVVGDDAFDVMILDRVMPVMDGVTVLQHLRAANLNLPVLMLTAFGKANQKVEGLEAGADDYVVKPIDALELNARLNALVRARHWTTEDSDTIRAGGIVVSPTKYRAWRDGKSLDLPRTELRLLTELARNAGAVLTRPMLLEKVWNYDFEPTTNIVDTYIKRLRKKLTEDGSEDPITTLRGVGYMLNK